MRISCRAAVVVVATLSVALQLASMSAHAQAQASADDKAANARAKRLAEQFEAQARRLTVFDRQGKVVTTVGERALYFRPVFSPDRTRLAVTKMDLESETEDVWMREEDAVRWGRFSPDSRFTAYVLDTVEAGAFEIHVRPFNAAQTEGGAGAVKPVRVANADRDMISWRHDGKELYYRQNNLQTDDALVMAVDVSTTPTFQTGTPQLLFRLQGVLRSGWSHSLGVSRDGQRFVCNVNVPAGSTPAR